jgi:hypothetical protein
MTDHYLYLDVESTGLDVQRHSIWEIGYAIDDEPVNAAVVSHTLVGADDRALEIGNYWHRMYREPFSAHEGVIWEAEMRRRLETFEGTLYLVGANPGFDKEFLQARWGVTPWHYRTIDVESYAMGPIGPLLSDPIVPVGLYRICELLRTLGWDIPQPDHSAGGDVEATRAAFKALVKIEAGDTP